MLFSSLSRGKAVRLARWTLKLSAWRDAVVSRSLPAVCGFTVEMLRNPRSIGAVCPSGPQLAGGMASLVPVDGDGLIVEIGAGTGAVTQAILQRGVRPERMLVIERSPVFCRVLREKFPQLRIVQGDAALLASYVPSGRVINAVVSSLPLMSLPRGIRADILHQIKHLLLPGGCVVQFTYMLWGPSPFRRQGYTCDKRRIVLRNVPPARLERFWAPGTPPASSALSSST